MITKIIMFSDFAYIYYIVQSNIIFYILTSLWLVNDFSAGIYTPLFIKYMWVCINLSTLFLYRVSVTEVLYRYTKGS